MWRGSGKGPGYIGPSQGQQPRDCDTLGCQHFQPEATARTRDPQTGGPESHTDAMGDKKR